MLRVDIIGLGFMGRVHLQAWGKVADAKVVAVSDQDPKRASGDLSGTDCECVNELLHGRLGGACV